jgi:putative phosphoesterase
MITVVSDTHARNTHHLNGRTLDAVRESDLVLHAGDFTTEAVLDAFESESTRFAGVIGNSDTPALSERLPRTRTVEHEGIRITIVHGHEHSKTGLSLLGRQENADLVVVGHSHKPEFRTLGDISVLNPGSHASPRGNRPAHAEISLDPLRGRLVEPNGTTLETFTIDE